ncbi:MAG: hypothetical protein M1829_001136 [Trizodia sp. TS-e1964]|nr:MAG: hypothetical protein M1829_001136 [Trizodia sp. TS-e1964]
MSSLQGVGGVTPPRISTRRSSSGNFPPPSTSTQLKSPLSGIVDEPNIPAITPASIASTHFREELERHVEDDVGAGAAPKTIVVLHDSCYGHRYSRPRTSRFNLATIVERPERIHASVIGISAAYVRLGGRHIDGPHPPHPRRNPRLLPSLPFRIRKTTRKVALTSPAVAAVHGLKWMEELKVMCVAAESKLSLNGLELVRPPLVHGKGQDEDERLALHEGDLYLCSESLNALEGAVGAVCEAVDAIFQGTSGGKSAPKRSFVTIRPPGHHCSSSYPSGFCWINNVHVGIAHAALSHGLTHAAIIDFDLHHGDGSQDITWAHNARVARLPKSASSTKKSAIGYFSLHDINSYPCEMGDEEKIQNASLCIENAHGQTVWNVHLQAWKTEAEFWELYETRYLVLIEKARGFLRSHYQRLPAAPGNHQQPKAAIFLSAGFDASEWESPGMQRHKVNVPTDFYARLTRDIVRLAEEEGTGVDGRIVSVLEGGYSNRALSSGILSHLSGLVGGEPVAIKKGEEEGGLGYEMGKRLGYSDDDNLLAEASSTPESVRFDPAWWALHRLEELEALTHPPPAPPSPKRGKSAAVSTYSSPTQSFAAKVVSSPKVYRKSSASSLSGSRAPSPPLPEVDWATAAHELSKLLIPTNRQTFSCSPEELSVAESNRIKRDRLPTAETSGPCAAPTNVVNIEPNNGNGNGGARMTLRDRKGKAPAPTSEPTPKESSVTAPSWVGRRKTVAGHGLGLVNDIAAKGGVSGVTTTRRRLSIASSISSLHSEMPIKSEFPSKPELTTNGRNAPRKAGPGSSANIAPPSAVVVARKSRVVRQEGRNTEVPSRSSSRAPKKQPTVPARLSSNTGAISSSSSANLAPNTGANGSAKATVKGNGPTKTGQRSLSQTAADVDVESLSTGMRRIKLNVPTKEEHDAREKKRAAELAAALARGSSQGSTNPSSSTDKAVGKAPTGRKTTAATTAATRGRPPKKEVLTSKAAAAPLPQQPPPPTSLTSVTNAASLPACCTDDPTVAAIADGAASSVLSNLQTLSLSENQPNFPNILPSTPPNEAVSSPSTSPTDSSVPAETLEFIPYTIKGAVHAPQPVASTTLTWLPPNSSTSPPPPHNASPPAHAPLTGRLPVFTASSAIPFGRPASSADSELGSSPGRCERE